VSDLMDRPIQQRWWRKKPWIQAAGALAAIALIVGTAIAFFGTAERSVRVPAANLTLAKVERNVFHDFIPLRGQVVPLETIYLDALEGGRVERVLAVAGDSVVLGQALVELSNTQLELDVLDREGRLVESMTQLQAYQTQLEQNRLANEKALAQIDYDIIRLQRSLDRRTALSSRGAESEEQRDVVQDELNHDVRIRPVQEESNKKQEQLRVQQLPQIQAQIEKLQQDLRVTHSKLDNLTVRAPVAGRLTAMDLKVGENRNRGERFAEITPDVGFKISADVDEFYLRRVRNGQTAVVEMDERNWTLTVVRVYPQVKDGTFKIDLAFGAAIPGNLLPGQAVQGRLALGADQLATVLPAGAFLERTGGDWIFVLAPGGTSAERRRITIGRRNAEQVEVLTGLTPGEEVITSDYTGFERTDRINLVR
jgi:HlyD family secretion protein